MDIIATLKYFSNLHRSKYSMIIIGVHKSVHTWKVPNLASAIRCMKNCTCLLTQAFLLRYLGERRRERVKKEKERHC